MTISLSRARIMARSQHTAREATIIANVAAGIEVGKLGAAGVATAMVLAYVDMHTLHV
jgi:bifunctional ADP-heptose synthase (sugar kinase/adenylyltransferase)